jgi:hypothetical protein
MCVSYTADFEETRKNCTFEVEEDVGGLVIETVASHSMGILIMFVMVSRHMVAVRVHIAIHLQGAFVGAGSLSPTHKWCSLPRRPKCELVLPN